MSVLPEPGLVLAGLPSTMDWEFGGFTYGLEPLTLPEPGAPDAAERPGDLPENVYGTACELIWRAGEDGVPGLSPAVTKDGAEELYWFRWITGHQVSFISWRLMAQLAAGADSGAIPVRAALEQMRRFVRLYTAMLLYTGSCTGSLYHEMIRPSMRLRHPSFSGGWAPDFWPVRDLLRARRLAFPSSEELASFVEAVKVHQLVHDGIAAKLVPNGASLLRQSSVRGTDMKLLHILYDNYFLTLRAGVGRQRIVAQMLRRLMAIAQDVAVNGLCLDGGDAELPAQLLMGEAMRCVSEFADILSDAACCAAQLPARARPSHTAGTR
jgi:L-tyrosine peroxygenase